MTREEELKRASLEAYPENISYSTVIEQYVDYNYDNYTKHILACDVQFKPFTHLYNCAKHFFELGLKAQKGE